MKRYESMTNLEIMDAFNKPDELPDNVCDGCIVWDYDTTYNYCNHRCAHGEKGTCHDIIRRFLNEEVTVTPRWKTFTCDEDVQKSLEEWYKTGKEESLIAYLCDKIEDRK